MSGCCEIFNIPTEAFKAHPKHRNRLCTSYTSSIIYVNPSATRENSHFFAFCCWCFLGGLTHLDAQGYLDNWVQVGKQGTNMEPENTPLEKRKHSESRHFFCMLVFRGVHSREVTYNAKCEKEHHLQECRLGIWTCSQQGYSLWKESHNTNIWSFWGIFRCNHALFGLVIKNYSLWMGNHVNRTLKKQHLTRSMGKKPIEQPKSPTAFVVISLPKSWKLCFWAICEKRR